MKNPKFQVFMGKADEQFYFRLRAENGEIILGSEGYTAKLSCMNGIESVKGNSQDDSNFKRKTTSNDQFHFVLVAKNGETIGSSETYTTKQAMENGIEAVRRVALEAQVED